MNADKQKTLAESSRRNPFWVCFLVFLLLACDYGYRLMNLLDQREQLNQAVLMQAQNVGALKQAQQLEARLESLSLELLQIAKTNPAAKQIVQDFNIQWTPGPAASVPATAPSVPAPAAGAQKQ
jgi:hypothetical protein